MARRQGVMKRQQPVGQHHRTGCIGGAPTAPTQANRDKKESIGQEKNKNKFSIVSDVQALISQNIF